MTRLLHFLAGLTLLAIGYSRGYRDGIKFGKFVGTIETSRRLINVQRGRYHVDKTGTIHGVPTSSTRRRFWGFR